MSISFAEDVKPTPVQQGSALENKLIAHRRELHQHPELSNQEFVTTQKITDWLNAAGIRILPLGLKTGVVAEIGPQQGPVVALRGDIDALPIEETSGVPFSSRQAGVMHACGHDVHTSVILGAAYLLKAREDQLPGRVRLFFQPAEERFGGASQLINAGALENVDVIFGLHNAPELPVGTFATKSGAFYANVDRFQITITGKGAHAAHPEEGVDSIVTASQIVSALQTVVSRNVSAQQAAVVSVTRIEGGNTWNVLPQTVLLEGTVRTHSNPTREQIPQRIRQLIGGVADALGAKAELQWFDGPPAVVNTPRWADFSLQAAAEFGYQAEVAPLQMGGEDFAFYLHHVPGAFVSIGSASEFGLHHPQFNPDEAAIYPAANYFQQLAEKALRELSAQ
ncbi:M20 peptidase aminoacylase family protein [Serratia odorifera]|uniref:Amidohydrolase n=1 Tax=Serratia odorifera DSM 4582 TaxID=667129 RepID=D4E417_SEROD|nr:M20 peptidase aminoacylase family protein [Serratia odorifera]EFE95497.1 amidohydrolase [Serratia odorifera DSM 4582]PNK82471.1 amidohydrolase [Serratia odorifera]PNK90143.1 amidohydrolase [Serratia odorifera]RII71222.1 amidohydrolase [Serratia odorifera]